MKVLGLLKKAFGVKTIQTITKMQVIVFVENLMVQARSDAMDRFVDFEKAQELPQFNTLPTKYVMSLITLTEKIVNSNPSISLKEIRKYLEIEFNPDSRETLEIRYLPELKCEYDAYCATLCI